MHFEKSGSVGSGPDAAAEAPTQGRWRFIFLGLGSVAIVGLILLYIGNSTPPSAPSGPTTTTSTSYSVVASSVLDLAAANPPDGYSEGSLGLLNPNFPGLVSGGFRIFTKQIGSAANLTVLVFDTPQSAQAYAQSVIDGVKGLPGYTNVTGVLSGYRHYGVCYAFGESDPEGNGAVATGVCTKGNVYILVHVVSPVSLSSAQGDMSDLVGDAYQGAA